MDTQNSKATWIVAAAAFVVIAVGAFVLYRYTTPVAPATDSGTSTSTATTTTAGGEAGALSVEGTGGYTIGIDSVSDVVPAPDYHKPIQFDTSVSADVRSALNAQLSEAQALIQKNPLDFNTWVALGGIYKTGGDYKDAATVWEYCSKEWPTNQVSFANLADLYTHFLPNYPKAATNYKQAIKNNPTQVYLYLDLFALYTNQYPQSSATVEAVLKQGLTANPGNQDLQSALDQYQTAHS